MLAAIPKALLYWDEVCIPLVMPGSIPLLDAAVDSLEGLGVLKRFVAHEGAMVTGQFPAYVAKFLAMLTGAGMDGPEWTYVDPLGQTEFDLLFNFSPTPKDTSIRKRAIELGIRDALPVPPSGTAYEDIVNFRRTRADELKVLDLEIQFLSMTLMGAETIEDAIDTGQVRVSKALSDLDAVAREKWPERLLSSLRTKTSAMAAGTVAGTIAAGGFSFPLLAGAILGGAATPVIEAILETATTTPPLPERHRPYFYAFQAERMFKSTL